jgi:TfoX/Sxy family transcriptional regulator of competence genes
MRAAAGDVLPYLQSVKRQIHGGFLPQGFDRIIIPASKAACKICRFRVCLKKGGDFMASSKEYLEFVLDQLRLLDGISYRAMMGEFILYYRGRIPGGIYDDRLLIKPVPAAVEHLPDAPREIPYPGAKEMLLVEEIDDRAFLAELFDAMVDELPAPKKTK